MERIEELENRNKQLDTELKFARNSIRELREYIGERAKADLAHVNYSEKVNWEEEAELYLAGVSNEARGRGWDPRRKWCCSRASFNCNRSFV